MVQPAGCVDGLEQNGTPTQAEVLVGDAWFVGLRESARRPWPRSLIALSHGEDPNAVTLSACHGHYPSAFFPGHFRVRRPLCDVPLDWRYGGERGRLRLSFGRACG